jgi:PAS domain S-box-containing protein
MNPADPLIAASVLDCVADGVFTVDADWRITSFNQAAEEITGLSRDDVLGRPCREVFQASICESGCGLKRAIDNDKSVLMRAIYITNGDGERVPVSISAAVLRDLDGQVIGGVETFRDLSLVQVAHDEPVRASAGLGGIVGHSPAMQRVFDLLPVVAESDSTVLIEGDSGTGKELIARAVHELSCRRKRPMVAVNCGAIPDTLLESELFGHKAGAFTDARRDKPGRFALADGGTLFLDEIGEVSPALQVRLLRVLQERVYEPLGGTESVPVDVRIIAATNRNLRELVDRGVFRRDLYYRVNVVRIQVPPLRDRREDIPALIDHFLAGYNERRTAHIEGVAPEVMRLMMVYDFPGNVRELQNVLEHASVLCGGGVIRREHLPPELGGRDAPDTVGDEPVMVLQRNLIQSALDRHAGNRRAAARDLGIHVTTLWRQARKLGIELPEQDGRSHHRH